LECCSSAARRVRRRKTSDAFKYKAEHMQRVTASEVTPASVQVRRVSLGDMVTACVSMQDHSQRRRK
jgi:hypothetical protein